MKALIKMIRIVVTLIFSNYTISKSQTYSCDFKIDPFSWNAYVLNNERWIYLDWIITNLGPTNTPGATTAECHVYFSTTKSLTSAIQIGIWKNPYPQVFEKGWTWTEGSGYNITSVPDGDYYIGIYKTTEGLDPNANNNWGWFANRISISSTTVGIEDSKHTNKCSIYPNPTNSTIVINGLVPGSNVTIIDINGNIILHEKIVDDQINVSNLSKGYYTLILDNRVESEVHKFIKQ